MRVCVVIIVKDIHESAGVANQIYRYRFDLFLYRAVFFLVNLCAMCVVLGVGEGSGKNLCNGFLFSWALPS